MTSSATNNSIDEKFYQLLKDKKIFFDVYLKLDSRKVINARVVDFSMQDRLLELNRLRVKFWDINRLEFTGVNAVKFFKEILPELPESVSKKNFDGKTIYIYPFGEKGYQKWTLLKEYPYFLILHGKEKVQKNKKGKPKISHIYVVKYKLFISAHSLFSPYPERLIEEGELYDVVEAGAWRKGAKDIASMLNEELGEAEEKLLTFALKDGREVTGVFEKKRSYMPFRYRLYDPDNRKRGITIYKHAVDDFWEVT